jgi:hypothetical protein
MDLSRKGDELVPLHASPAHHRASYRQKLLRWKRRLATKQEKRIRQRTPIVIVPLIVAAPRRSLEVPIPPVKKEVVVVPAVARNEGFGRRVARDEAALGLVVQHRDELGAIVGLGAQRLIRDDD